VDRLSDLPEELRLEILGRLGGAREAARTGVLSRLWRGLWTLLQELAFRGVGTGSVEAALAQLADRPAPLDLLDVRVEEEEYVTPGRISSLLSAVARLALKSLTVTGARGCSPQGKSAVVLPCLDHTASLTIDLLDFSLAPPQTGEFAALKSLSLSWSEIDVMALLSLCPWLRILHLHNCFMSIDGARHAVVHLPLLEELLLRESFLDYIDIEAPVLKKLKVELTMDYGEVSIWFSAPMVERVDWVLVYEVDVSFGQLWRMNSVREIVTNREGKLPVLRSAWRERRRHLERESTGGGRRGTGRIRFIVVAFADLPTTHTAST
jgi:hypothetical protein